MKFVNSGILLVLFLFSIPALQVCLSRDIHERPVSPDSVNKKEILNNETLPDSTYVYNPGEYGIWNLHFIELFYYSKPGIIDSVYYRSADPDSFPSEKLIYNYNAYGQLTKKSTYFTYDVNWEFWSEKDRLTLNYNNKHQLESSLFEDCSSYIPDTMWIEKCYYTDDLLVKRDKFKPVSVDTNIYHNIIEYHYNDRKLLSDSVTYSLKGIKLFDDMRKFSFKYDDYDSITSVIITVSKDGNKWNNFDKTDITYNSMGKVSQVYDYIWIDTIPGWLNLDRTTYYYNENKLLDSIYGLELDNQQWVDAFRDYTTYTDGNRISCNWRKYTKTRNSNLWYNNNKICYTYYPDSSVTIYQEGEYYIYDDIWFNRVKVVNYFGRNSSVYHDILDNTIPEGETVDIFVYDLPGRLVWHDSLPYSVKMRIEDILTNVESGCYFALIKSKNVTLNKKVLVIH